MRDSGISRISGKGGPGARDHWGFGSICALVDSTEDLPAGCNYKDKVAHDLVPVLLNASVISGITKDEPDGVRTLAFVVLQHPYQLIFISCAVLV